MLARVLHLHNPKLAHAVHAHKCTRTRTPTRLACTCSPDLQKHTRARAPGQPVNASSPGPRSLQGRGCTASLSATLGAAAVSGRAARRTRRSSTCATRPAAGQGGHARGQAGVCTCISPAIEPEKLMRRELPLPIIQLTEDRTKQQEQGRQGEGVQRAAARSWAAAVCGLPCARVCRPGSRNVHESGGAGWREGAAARMMLLLLLLGAWAARVRARTRPCKTPCKRRALPPAAAAAAIEAGG